MAQHTEAGQTFDQYLRSNPNRPTARRVRLYIQPAGEFSATERRFVDETAGRQYRITVGTEEYWIDLLFYHLKLRSFVAIDLKTGAFKPEYAGKMNFYLGVLDDQLRHPTDSPTVGLILCQDRNRVVAEYALRGKLNGPCRKEFVAVLWQIHTGEYFIASRNHRVQDVAGQKHGPRPVAR